MGKARILFDVAPKVYFPGEIVRGNIEVEGCNDPAVKSINLQCAGIIHYKSKKHAPLIEMLAQLENEGRTSVLFRKDQCLMNVASEGRTRTGKRSFPFAYPIETKSGGLDLPSSFSNRYVAIVYYLSVTISRTWSRKDTTRTHPFVVACWNDASAPIHQRPLLLSRGIDVGVLGIFKKGTIDARITIPKQAFLKGDHIPVRLQVNHLGSVKRITGLSVGLVRHVRWRHMARTASGSSTPAGEPPSPEQEEVKLKGCKVTPLETAFTPLDIKPGQVNVDVTVRYFLDPSLTSPNKNHKPLLVQPGTTVALSYSDEFPWSSCITQNGASTPDNMVQISYELRVRLDIGSIKSSNAAALSLDDSQSEASAQTATSDGSASLLDSMLSGGDKSLDFSFPIVIGTISEAPSASLPPAASTSPTGADSVPNNSSTLLRRRTVGSAAPRPSRPRGARQDPATTSSGRRGAGSSRAPIPDFPAAPTLATSVPSSPAIPHPRRAKPPTAPPAPPLRTTSEPASSSSVASYLPHSISFPPPLPPRSNVPLIDPTAPDEDAIGWHSGNVVVQAPPVLAVPPSAPPVLPFSQQLQQQPQQQVVALGTADDEDSDVAPPPYSFFA
ncbi:hypothetical protein HKX48_001859 [Thoreauomyces humboldtii]|nr:hypothetical protein HKX48_001859 [Thoreauomyces humboldtii]